jgi:hypothetical protein
MRIGNEPTKQPAVIFIDGDYIYDLRQKLKINVNFAKLKNYFVSLFPKCEIRYFLRNVAPPQFIDVLRNKNFIMNVDFTTKKELQLVLAKQINGLEKEINEIV